MKKTSTILICAALAAAVASAQEKPAPAPDPKADSVVISAGGIQIRRSEFENAIKALPAEYQQYATGAGKKQFAEDYLRMKLIAAQGFANGLDKDAEVVRQMALMRENLVATAQIARIEKSISISEQDLRKEYEARRNEYEQVTARHILIAFKGSPAALKDRKELTEEEAKAKAEALRKQILAGASFEDVAKKESDDTGSGASGGDLGPFVRGQMVPEFEKAAFEAKPGELTPVVRTQFGYHIIKVERHGTTPFEEVKATLAGPLRQKALQAELQALKDKARPVFDDAYFGTAATQQPPAATDGKKPH